MEVTAMRRSILSVSVLLAALVAAVVSAAARADGLPVLGIDVGSAGVASSSDGTRYVTIPGGKRTIVEQIAQHGGQVLAWRSLRGTFTIPAVAYDGSAGGLSADGTTLVLIEPRTSFPRATTKLVVLSSDGLKPLRVVKLQGDFSFEALSAHCIDLDGIASGTDLWQLRLGLDRDGKQLVVRDSASRLLLIDLRTLSVTRATAAGAHAGGTRQLPVFVFVAAGGFVLAVVVAGVIWARRRRRQILFPNLEPPSMS